MIKTKAIEKEMSEMKKKTVKTNLSLENKKMEKEKRMEQKNEEEKEFVTLIDNMGKEHNAVIRIKKVVLDNFKNVGHGEIVLNCGREFVSQGTESDILGIYGQNGSGKTSFVEALAILKSLMRGATVPIIYVESVAVGADCAKLEFVFEIQYPDGFVREATYSFNMGIKPLTEEEILEYSYKFNRLPDNDNKVIVYNEKFSLIWENASKRQLIIDTSSEDVPFTPDTKRKELVGTGLQVLGALKIIKQSARESSQSFIFTKDVFEIFANKSLNSIPFRVLTELRYYARHCLYVVDTKSSGFIRLNFALPVYTKQGKILFNSKSTIDVTTIVFDEIKAEIERISSVVEQLIPGLTIRLELKEGEHMVSRTRKPVVTAELKACRDGVDLPLHYESDGIRKIVSVLGLIIEAFNHPSVTVAIDEFDAGVFEYLLGEILQAFEESGKGQFVFTSHNLRPLEVINKKFLYFTTTNPENRYIRLKNISATNNLRDTYFREIVLCEQEEEIYKKTKRFKMIAALKKVGGE